MKIKVGLLVVAISFLAMLSCKADVDYDRGVSPLMVSLGSWDCPSDLDVYGVHISPFMWGKGPRYMEGISLGLFDSILCGYGAGVQLSGVGSLMSGHLFGVQIGGLFSVANHMRGLQISSLYSRAKDANGVQIGIVNYTDKAHGFLFQLGLVNIIDGRVLPIINMGW